MPAHGEQEVSIHRRHLFLYNPDAALDGL